MNNPIPKSKEAMERWRAMSNKEVEEMLELLSDEELEEIDRLYMLEYGESINEDTQIDDTRVVAVIDVLGNMTQVELKGTEENNEKIINNLIDTDYIAELRPSLMDNTSMELFDEDGESHPVPFDDDIRMLYADGNRHRHGKPRPSMFGTYMCTIKPKKRHVILVSGDVLFVSVRKDNEKYPYQGLNRNQLEQVEALVDGFKEFDKEMREAKG